MRSDDAAVTVTSGTPASSAMPDTALTDEQVYAAIAGVLDPELDEPLVQLGFIDQVEIDGPDVTVTFKLPTFWCSPNFAYLMAADLRSSILRLPGIRHARVVLLDHCDEEAVTRGVNEGRTFAEAFEADTPEDADLENLRRIFLRKGFLMRQDTLLRHMLKAGLDEVTILALRVADLAVDENANLAVVTAAQGAMQLVGAGRHASAYLLKRQALGLSCAGDATLITRESGETVPAGGLRDFLRRSRSVRLSLMFNTALCKGLFRTRYENAGADEAHRDEEGY